MPHDFAPGPSEPGIISRDILRSTSGFEFLQQMLEGRLPFAPIGALLAFRPSRLAPGLAEFSANPGEIHYNPIGTVHGGYVSTLLDSCMACAVHSKLPAGRGYTTLELKVNFVRGVTAKTGTVRAIGTVIEMSRQIATAEGRLVDERDRLFAHATTTCLLFDFDRSTRRQESQESPQSASGEG